LAATAAETQQDHSASPWNLIRKEGGDMKTKQQEKRKTYHAPQLFAYGKLETITASVSCTFNKIGSSPDDVTLLVPNIHGDPVCT
jgi:hypothetical protein